MICETREVDATIIIYINPGQMQELADGITCLIEGIRLYKEQHRQMEVRKARVKEDTKGIKDYYGLIAEEVRLWIDSIDLALMAWKCTPINDQTDIGASPNALCIKEINNLFAIYKVRQTY